MDTEPIARPTYCIAVIEVICAAEGDAESTEYTVRSIYAEQTGRYEQSRRRRRICCKAEEKKGKKEEKRALKQETVSVPGANANAKMR